jgi:hypothetical protein
MHRYKLCIEENKSIFPISFDDEDLLPYMFLQFVLEDIKDGKIIRDFRKILEVINLQPKDVGLNENKLNSIDYILPLKHCQNIGRFFKIQYLPKLNQFIIKDLGNGLGTFIKIKDLIYIRNKSMINIGDSYLTLYFVDSTEDINKKNSKENNDNNNINGIGKKLKIKVFENKSNDTKEFIFENNIERTIHIGRKNHGNEIEINDSLSSKVNCIIHYNDKKGWSIKDGNEVILKNGDIKRNYSKNGTWFLAYENIKIIDTLVIKSNFNIFVCNYRKINK